VADGDAQHPHPLTDDRVGDLALDDLAPLPRPGDQRALLLVGDLAQEVAHVEGLVGGGADLAGDDEVGAVGVGGDEEEEVREAEIGHQTPRGGEALEVAQLGRVELCLGARDLGEAGHGARVGPHR
jgi:hypothetical protein